jgi:pyruvate dehydrogenase E2 component (dihydrolipoamide acetyltransferase)
VAVGAIEDRAVPVGGDIVVRPMTTLMGTFDHRAVDGAPAAGFIETLKTLLEDPALAL